MTGNISPGHRLGKAASCYARLGWRVLPTWWIENGRCACPLHTPLGGKSCPPGKHARIKAWPERATCDQATIAEWWSDWPYANLAVATGPGSGILVIDVDGPDGEASLAKLEFTTGPLPAHLPPMDRQRSRLAAVLCLSRRRQDRQQRPKARARPDTRGEGGYALLPPSVTQQTYRWAPGRSPWRMKPATLPTAWQALLAQPAEDGERGTFDPEKARAALNGDAYTRSAIARISGSSSRG
jgi:hypothetical protein